MDMLPNKVFTNNTSSLQVLYKKIITNKTKAFAIFSIFLVQLPARRAP